MSKTINASTDLFTPVEVNLWGKMYGVVEPTRAIERRTAKALEAAENLPDDATDEALFAVEVEVLDTLLEAMPDDDGKKTSAKVHLKALYKSEKIGRAHVDRLFTQLVEAREQTVPS